MADDPMVAVLAPGRVFHGRYEVVRCLRSGGMGAIYEVIHIETRRRRALKIMLPSIVSNPEMQARFKLEATVAADIESEHIVETFDAGVDPETGAPFLVMELLRGEDLGTLLDREGPLPADDVVLLLSQAASALDKTHAAGVVHRDLKPENLFVSRRDDGAPKLKILDFGIAKVVSESGQGAAKTKILGTPLYMSPEQIRGDGTIGPRADLYAVGHIAFALLTGRAYWDEVAEKEQIYTLMLKVVAGKGVPATEMAARWDVSLPAAFDAWFARCTANEPSDRFETASELVETLAAVLSVPLARAAASSLKISFAERSSISPFSSPPNLGPTASLASSPEPTSASADSAPDVGTMRVSPGASTVTLPRGRSPHRGAAPEASAERPAPVVGAAPEPRPGSPIPEPPRAPSMRARGVAAFALALVVLGAFELRAALSSGHPAERTPPASSSEPVGALPSSSGETPEPRPQASVPTPIVEPAPVLATPSPAVTEGGTVPAVAAGAHGSHPGHVVLAAGAAGEVSKAPARPSASPSSKPSAPPVPDDSVLLQRK